MADITLADFWGIENYSRKLEKNLGTSLVMVNSQKGLAYFEEVKKKLHFIDMPFESILQGNLALTTPLKFYGGDREAFFRDLDLLPFGEVIDKYSNYPVGKKQKIKNLIKKEPFFIGSLPYMKLKKLNHNRNQIIDNMNNDWIPNIIASSISNG